MFDKVLIQKYLDDKYSIREISKILDVKYMKLYNFVRKEKLRYSGTKINGTTEASKAGFKRRTNRVIKFTKDELHDLYVTKNYNRKKIAEIFDVNDITIYNYLKKWDIPLKNHNGTFEKYKPDVDKETLNRLYNDEKKSTYEIMNILNEDGHDIPNSATVVYMMEHYKIKRRNYSQAGKEKLKNPEYKQKFLKAIFESEKKCKYKDTWIELAFEAWLQKNEYEYEKQYQIEAGSHFYDFKVGDKILVEVDGDYWHSTEKAQKRDKHWNKFAIEHDFDIIRIWEKDIKKFGEQIFEEKIPTLWI